MEEIALGLPEPILDALPGDEDDAAEDMRRAVADWERRLNEAVEGASDDREAAERVADAIERMEDRLERYDEFVPELRAWGQSPIYAMAWRNLHASVIQQIYDHGDLADRIDRERNARIVDDGIRKR